MTHLYTFAVRLYVLGINLAAFFKPKARLWVDGRKDWPQKLAIQKQPGQKLVWFHCASLGEFEQARPVIEQLKKEEPTTLILLSFFSPSGFEVRKNYALADRIVYLPADTPQNVHTFLSIIQPDLLVLVKYEYWFNFLQGLQERGIPILLIAGRFHPKQLFFRAWGGWAKEILCKFNGIHVQETDDLSLLQSIGISHGVLSGDPRYDRTAENAALSEAIPEIQHWIGNRKCWVAGSTWLEDEQLLFPWDNEHALIIAPHEIHEGHLRSIEQNAKASTLRYSKLKKEPGSFSSVLIIDNIGMLMRIYGMADAAWVGGAFRTGLHNILEPAAFGIPVYFGPKHEKFPEAAALIKAGGGFSVSEKAQWLQILTSTGSHVQQKAGKHAATFIEAQRGASRKIVPEILNLLNHA